MKILDRILLTFFSICLTLISLVLIILPFNIEGLINIGRIAGLLESIKGNYLYSILGLIVFLINIIFLLSGIWNKEERDLGSFLVMRNDFGEILIYKDTIVGLIHNVSNKFSQINIIKTNVEFIEGYITLIIRGEVNQEVNIPDSSKDFQGKVKEYIEDITGAIVSDIKMEITNVLPTSGRAK